MQFYMTHNTGQSSLYFCNMTHVYHARTDSAVAMI